MQSDEQALDPAAHHLDKYRPIARIGRGGMAEVLLAVLAGPAQVRKLLVLKRPLSVLSRDPDFSARFLAEARIAARLNHPNVISTYEVGVSADGPFIVMEYLDGQPLSKVFGRLGALQMPLSYRLHVLRSLLAGLDYVHTLTDFDGRGLRLVHRDVSPQNVFICYDGRVSLVDFGIAKAEGLGRNSRPGIIEGKIAYMAPEQLSGRPADHRADLFAFGVILWETLTGQRITLGAPEEEIVRRRTRGDLPDICEFAPETPQALIDLCQRTLTLLPEDRIPSAAAIIESLDLFIDRMGARINDREVGQYIGNAFSAERDARRRLIESQMTVVEHGLPPSTHLPDLSRAVSPSVSASSDSLADFPPAHASDQLIAFPAENTRATVPMVIEGSPTAPTVIPSETLVPRRRNRRSLLAWSAVGAAAGAVVIWLALSGGTSQDARGLRPMATRKAAAATLSTVTAAPPVTAAKAPAVIALPVLLPAPAIDEARRVPVVRPTPSTWRATLLRESAARRSTAASAADGRPLHKSSGRSLPAPGESMGHAAPPPKATIDADNPYAH